MRIGLREIIFGVLLLALPVGAWWFVFRPGNQRNAQMLAQIEQRRQKLVQLNQATATIGDLRNEITSLEEAITFFRSKLPSEKEIDKVLREVWKTAETNQLATKSIRPLKAGTDQLLTDPNGPYAEQPISIQLEGPFPGFYGFLLALEAQPRIMRLQQMNIERLAPSSVLSPGSEEGQIKANCVVSIFFERNKE
jgi:Tfp pilus assembly protein PilO